MPALEQTPTSSDVRQTIASYLFDDVENPCISIADAVSAVRRTFPFCELTDWQLGDLVARIAIDAGFAIEFDGAEPPKSLP
ncbi:hypothetical protein EOD23_26665 [Mesorhizobium sp. USDA-HM6]|nr:hypothetical protein EOD23_26665 [Mesorhizobium sp. USDA-HM6]